MHRFTHPLFIKLIYSCQDNVDVSTERVVMVDLIYLVKTKISVDAGEAKCFWQTVEFAVRIKKNEKS